MHDKPTDPRIEVAAKAISNWECDDEKYWREFISGAEFIIRALDEYQKSR